MFVCVKRGMGASLSPSYLGLEVVYRGHFETILLCHQANSTLADRPGVRTGGDARRILAPALTSG